MLVLAYLIVILIPALFLASLVRIIHDARIETYSQLSQQDLSTRLQAIGFKHNDSDLIVR